MTLEEIEDWIDSGATADRERFRREIEALIPQYDAGEPGRAELLLALAQSLLADPDGEKDLRRAEEAAREAVADGGPTTIHPRVHLVDALLDRGRREEAMAEVKAALGVWTWEGQILHSSLGEGLELRGFVTEALRVYTVGLRDFDPELDEPDFDEEQCLSGRFRLRRELGRGLDALDRAFDETRPDAAAAILERIDRTAGDEVAEEGRLGLLGVLFWPEPEWERLWQRWPDLAAGYGDDFDEHRGLVEDALREYAARDLDVAVAPATLDGLLAYAQFRQLDPDSSRTRAAYAADLVRRGKHVPWPPGSGDPCWCGSTATYRSCCQQRRP